MQAACQFKLISTHVICSSSKVIWVDFFSLSSLLTMAAPESSGLMHKHLVYIMLSSLTALGDTATRTTHHKAVRDNARHACRGNTNTRGDARGRHCEENTSLHGTSTSTSAMSNTTFQAMTSMMAGGGTKDMAMCHQLLLLVLLHLFGMQRTTFLPLSLLVSARTAAEPCTASDTSVSGLRA